MKEGLLKEQEKKDFEGDFLFWLVIFVCLPSNEIYFLINDMFLQGILAVIIFAFVPLAIKSTNANAITISLFRLFLTSIVLGLWWRKKIQFKNFLPRVEGSWKLWLLGIIFFSHWMFYVSGVKIGGASIGVLGLSTYGIQLIVASALFLNHKIEKREIFFMFLSMLGLILVVPEWNFHNRATLGLLFSFLSGTCFALSPIVHRKSPEHKTETRIYAQFFGSCLCFMFLFSKTAWDLKAIDWSMLVFLALGGTLIAHSLWAKLAMTLSPNVTGLAYYTIAPLTIIFSALFLREKFTLIQFIGAILIIGSSTFNLLTKNPEQNARAIK